MRKGAIIARRYSLVAFAAGSIYGVILAFISYIGGLDTLSPIERGLVGLLSSAILGALVTPLGAGFKYRLSRGVFLEAAIVSMLSTLVLWSTVYASLVR